MEIKGSGKDELCITNEEHKEFKSKNLHAERRRRKKLSDRLLTLRSHVPIITNMTRATIIEDAITYIETLKKTVDLLTQELLQMDASPPSSAEETVIMTESTDQINAAEEMKPCVIMEDIVEVSKISERKQWIKIMMKKKRGSLSRLMKAITLLGFELTDTAATTCNGSFLFSSSLQGNFAKLTVEQTKEHLLQIVRGI